MKKLITLLLMLPLVLWAQTKELDTPEIPSWVQDTIYFDFTNTSSANLGTYDDPVNSIPADSWAAVYGSGGTQFDFGWDSGMSTLRNAHNYALLFKRNITHEININLFRIYGDSVYVSSYGVGNKAEIKLNGQFKVFGEYTVIEHISISSYDPLHVDGVLSFANNMDNVEPFVVRMDSVTVHTARRGITLSNHIQKGFFNRLHVYNIGEDAMYDGDLYGGTDTIIISNSYFHDVNLKYFETPHDGSGGDIIQIPAQYLEITNSILDRSFTGHKFGVINSNTTSGVRIVFDNNIVIGHPHAHKGLRGGRYEISNSVFLGGHAPLDIWSRQPEDGLPLSDGPSTVHNSIFIGYGKDSIFNFYDQTGEPPRISQNHGFTSFYNNTVINFNTLAFGGISNRNIRNNIFYNLGDLSTSATIYGSGNIHWNDDVSLPANIDKYTSIDDYDNINPLLINPNSVTWVERDTLIHRRTFKGEEGEASFELYFRPQDGEVLSGISNGVIHSGTWFTVPNAVESFEWTSTYSWAPAEIYPEYIAEKIADEWIIRHKNPKKWWEPVGFDINNFRLQTASPAIDNADPNAYNTEATFDFDGTVRGYTDHILVTHDIAGTPRPQGSAYDIGAYEYTTSATTYALTTSTTGSGTIAKSPDKVNYDVDESVTLTANPASGWEFSSWSDDLSGSTNPETLVMNGNKSVTATFTETITPPPTGDILLQWQDYTTFTPLFGAVQTTTLLNAYNEQWDSIQNNLDILRQAVEAQFDTILTWDNSAITYLNFSMNGLAIRNAINNNNATLFLNMDAVYQAVSAVHDVPGYEDIEVTIMIAPTQQQFVGLFNWNIGTLIINTTELYNVLTSYYGY